MGTHPFSSPAHLRGKELGAWKRGASPFKGVRPLLVAIAFLAQTQAPAQACDESQRLILAGNPENTDARDALARSCARAGRHQQALAEYDRLLAVDSNNVDWLLGKGQALMALGRPAEALPLLEKARAASPEVASSAMSSPHHALLRNGLLRRIPRPMILS